MSDKQPQSRTPVESNDNSAAAARNPWFAVARLLPLLLAPAAIATCLIAESQDFSALFNKHTQERLALIVTGAAVFAAAISWLRQRALLQGLFLMGSAVVLLREIHWEWTTWFVYVALLGLCVFAHLKRNTLNPILQRRAVLRRWIIATAATYLLSQMIARRFFQHLFGDDSTVTELLDTRWFGMRFFGLMEEVVEVTAHLMLLITVLISGFGSATTGDETQADDSPPG